MASSTSRPRVPLRRVILVPIGLALLLHLVVLGRAWPQPERFMDRPDSTEYVALAANLLDGHGFSQAPRPPYEPDLRRTPLYPAVLAAAFAAGGRSPRVAAVLGVAIGLVTLVVLGAATKPGGWRMAAASVGLAASDLTSLAYHQMALTETMFALLLLSAVSLLLVRPARVPIGLSVGVLLGCATLCRPIAVALAPGLLLFYAWRARSGWRAALGEYLVLNVASGVVIGAWVLRNVATAGVLTLTAMGGVNMYLHRAAHVQATVSGRAVEDVRAELQRTFDAQTSRMSERDKLRWLDERGRNAVVAHPGAYLEASVRGLALMLGPDRDAMPQLLGFTPGSARARAAAVVGWAQLLGFYAIAGLGAVRAWRGASSREGLVLIGVVLVYFVAIGGPEMYPRFRMPLMPLVAILGGCAFAEESRTHA